MLADMELMLLGRNCSGRRINEQSDAHEILACFSLETGEQTSGPKDQGSWSIVPFSE
jgi:hypothetical protein